MKHIIQRKYSYIPYPQWMAEPYNPRGKQGLVRTEGTLVYTSPEVLHQEVKKLGDPSYTIFRRKKG